MLPFSWVDNYMTLTPPQKTVAHFIKSKLISSTFCFSSKLLSDSGGKYDTTKEDEVKKVHLQKLLSFGLRINLNFDYF